MKELIKNSLDKSLTYPDYITLVKDLAENNSTTIFPVPIDLFTPFIENMSKKGQD